MIAGAIVAMKNRLARYYHGDDTGSASRSPSPSEVSTTASEPLSPMPLEAPLKLEEPVVAAPMCAASVVPQRQDPAPVSPSPCDPFVAPTEAEMERFIADFDLDAGAAKMLRTHRNIKVKVETMQWMRSVLTNKKARSSIRNFSSVFVKRMVQADQQAMAAAPAQRRQRRRGRGAGETTPSGQSPEPRSPGSPSPSQRTPSPASSSPRNLPARPHDLKRAVTNVLNKVAPENMEAMVAQIACLRDEEEFGSVLAERTFHFAGRFHQYSDTYAELVVLSRRCMPPRTRRSFDDAVLDLTSVVVDVQSEDASDNKSRTVGYLRFLGALFVRGVVGVQRIEHQACGLLEENPTTLGVECSLELLKAVGYTMESSAVGRAILRKYMQLLEELSETLPKRVQFLIQDLETLAAKNWAYKCFNETAQTRHALHEKHRQQTCNGAVVAPACEERVAGSPPRRGAPQRPAWASSLPPFS
mmetsp:Transcript_44199/g.101009  ORF Transcript_44199/g.101009 Transcript_44199/m.101009 type:complete len:471 (-) Transcript_44199:786-2198(-)